MDNQTNMSSNEEPKAQHIIDLERDDLLTEFADINSISHMHVYDEVGNRHTMSEIWSEFKTIFVFVRSFLCFTTREYVEDLALIPRQTLIDKQIRLCVIGCAHWKHIKPFRKLTKFPYLMFCDVDNDIYNKLGFYKNINFGGNKDSVHVKSSNLGGLLSSTFRAIGSQSFDYQGRMDQQGGTIIAGPGPFLVFAHSDKHARDHCPINILLKKVGIEPLNFEQLRATKSIKA